MIETHPFGEFIPPDAQYIILGSFTGKSVSIEPGYDWYYGTKRNQFWTVIEAVYNRKLPTKAAKIKLFTELHIAIGDIIYQCERANNSNLDNNLINIVYNFDALRKVLRQNHFIKVFFTSRYVEMTFRKYMDINKDFPHIEFVTLPSPSPRYAKMTLSEKITRYAQLLPH